MFHNDIFYDPFLQIPFRSIFGPGDSFYSGSIFKSQELFDRMNDFINDHEYQLHYIPHDPMIEELPVDHEKMCNSLTQEFFEDLHDDQSDE